jgi:predicted RNA-binding Zn ribbon-like protein
VDFVRYAESSAALLNAELTDRDAVVAHLGGRAWLQPQVTDRDVTVLRRFAQDLRPAFEASSRGDAQGVVDVVNELLERHPITPRIADHNPDRLHIHVANNAASVAELLIAESLLGLANLVCDLGPTRLGVCAAAPCTNVYVDTSPNRSRRYCSERCSSRANVAAFRARQRAAAG